MAASYGLRRAAVFWMFLGVLLQEAPCHTKVGENLYVRILHPEDISYVYEVRPARSFGGVFEQYYDHVNLVPTDPIDACRPLENPMDLKDQIAFVQRGGCSFLSKALTVADTGAAAIFIYDHDLTNDWAFVDMIGDGTNRDTELPAAFMLGRDGQRIRESLSANGLKSAILTMPYNVTGIPFGHIDKAPWTLW